MQVELCGVPGTITRQAKAAAPLFKRQEWRSDGRPWGNGGWGSKALLHAVIRYDDSCNNGHNSFSITAEVSQSVQAGAIGCHHEAIAKVFPELAHLVRWHLADAEKGPLHAVANAVYHAGDRDHYGLRKGEAQQIRNGASGKPAWQLMAVNPETGEAVPLHSLDKYGDADSVADLGTPPRLEWRPWERIGEGKARDLDAARRCVVWPDAPESVLLLDRDELRPILEARIPALLAEFESDIRATGALAWEPDNSPQLVANTTRAAYWFQPGVGYAALHPDEESPVALRGGYDRLDSLMRLKGESDTTIHRAADPRTGKHL